MPWSQWVETMGFEPTTPCLQTVGLGVVVEPDLEPSRHGVASGARRRPDRMARVWPTPEATGRATMDSMGRATVWDLMVEALGVRSARRVASFMECWAITQRRWSEEPAVERFTHEWDMRGHRGRLLPS
jgi:hypothetical protein